MTPEQTDLARRLVAREEWRWMPGMLASDGHRLDDVDCDGLHPEAYGVMPDLNDPSTCGCLLVVLRQATYARGPERLKVWPHGLHWRVDVSGNLYGGPLGCALARALLNAWKAEDA